MKFFTFLLFCFQALSASASSSDSFISDFSEVRDSLIVVPATMDVRSKVLHDDFNELVRVMGVPSSIRLIVTSSSLVAQAFPGSVLAVNADVADVPKAQRMFVLAHELGHIMKDHIGSFVQLLKEKESIEKIYAGQGVFIRVNFTEQSHSNEFAADSFARDCLVKMKLSISDAAKFLVPFKDTPASESHPAVAERLQKFGVGYFD
jgi:hypothetical protein